MFKETFGFFMANSRKSKNFYLQTQNPEQKSVLIFFPKVLFRHVLKRQKFRQNAAFTSK